VSATGTNLTAVKVALKARLAARSGLNGVEVGYGPPRNADDLQDAEGDLRAVWFGANGGSDIIRPYMGSSVTHEVFRLEVVCQAIAHTEDEDQGQLLADQQAEAVLAEILSEIAANPTLSISNVEPLACLADGYQYDQLDRRANAWGAKYTLTVVSAPAGIAAPS
jgi:hypothetical protein